MLKKIDKGLGVRFLYNSFILYLFSKEDIKNFHEIFDKLEKKQIFTSNRFILNRIEDDAKDILILFKQKERKIDFNALFINLFIDFQKYFNSFLKKEFNIELGFTNGKFYNKLSQDKHKDEERFIGLIVSYLNHKYISVLEDYLKKDDLFLFGNYLSSKYNYIDSLGKGIIRFVIDLDRNFIPEDIEIFLGFIKRISLPELEIRLYYKNVNKNNYNKIINFLEINEEYNNIFHYIYFDDLSEYKYISEEIFGDFIKFVYRIKLNKNNFFKNEPLIIDNLEKIKENKEVVGVEVLFDTDIIELGLDNILEHIYLILEEYWGNWGKVFKINLQNFLLTNNKEIKKEIEDFINKNLIRLIDSFDLKKVENLNINDITLFNLLFIYDIYFYLNIFNEKIQEIEREDQDLYNKISYIIKNNPFSLYYKEYLVNFEELLIKDTVTGLTIDYPMIENFDNLIGNYNIADLLRKDFKNTLINLRNINLDLTEVENKILSKIL